MSLCLLHWQADSLPIGHLGNLQLKVNYISIKKKKIALIAFFIILPNDSQVEELKFNFLFPFPDCKIFICVSRTILWLFSHV